MRDPLYSIDSDIRAYALGIGAVEGAEWHPRQSVVRCMNCGERSAIDGAWCAMCEADPHVDYERRAAERAASVKRGHAQTAALLRRMGFDAEALWHEERAR